MCVLRSERKIESIIGFRVTALLSLSSMLMLVRCASDCSKFQSCESCLALSEQSCGRCTQQGSCSQITDCKRAEVEKNWLSTFNNTCPSITNVSKKNISLTYKGNADVYVTISNLPQKVYLMCQCITIFDQVVHVEFEYKNKISDDFRCKLSSFRLEKSVPPGQHYLNAILLVIVEGHFAESTIITFFDCRTYVSCESCVSSGFSCDWSVNRDRCVYENDDKQFPEDDSLVSKLHPHDPSRFCPKTTTNVTAGVDSASSHMEVTTNMAAEVDRTSSHMEVTTNVAAKIDCKSSHTEVNSDLLTYYTNIERAFDALLMINAVVILVLIAFLVYRHRRTNASRKLPIIDLPMNSTNEDKRNQGILFSQLDQRIPNNNPEEVTAKKAVDTV